jgi:adenylate cyclase
MQHGELEPPESDQTPETRDGEQTRDLKARRLRQLAVRVDTQPRLLSATERLRRRLPGDERFGDALSTTGTEPVEVLGRGVSALQPNRRSIAAELGFAGLQVWQSLSEAAGRGHGELELAVLFTDLVGFSAWALKAGDTAALAFLRDVGFVAETAVVEHTGRIVKRLGDGLMATFLDPREAVEAALDAQISVAALDSDGKVPRLRAGVHWGTPRRLGGDYLGVDVNIAARVCDAAKADQLLVSDALLEHCELPGLRIGRARRLRAAGAPRELHVAQVSRDE